MNKEKIKTRLTDLESSLNYITDAVNLLIIKVEANNQMLNSIINDLENLNNEKVSIGSSGSSDDCTTCSC